jgi:hypothetical protein
MALVGSKTVRRPLPHEEGEWFEFKQLSWAELETVERALTSEAQRVAGETIRNMGGDTFVAVRRAAAEQAEVKAKAAHAAPAKPGERYHGGTLLRLSLVGWSYEAPLTPETIDQLDQRTYEWAVKEATELSAPTEPEADRKNGYLASSSLSTG